MPIPEIPKGGWDSKEQMFAEYAKEPFRWSHEPIEFEWVEYDYRMQTPICTRYKADPSRFTCSNPKCVKDNLDGSLSMLRVMSTGLVWSCPSCQQTQGPLKIDNFEVLGKRRVTIHEAYEIMGRTNQAPPPGMPPRMGEKKLFKNR